MASQGDKETELKGERGIEIERIKIGEEKAIYDRQIDK